VEAGLSGVNVLLEVKKVRIGISWQNALAKVLQGPSSVQRFTELVFDVFTFEPPCKSQGHLSSAISVQDEAGIAWPRRDLAWHGSGITAGRNR
jgi:hypothetical protein